MAGHSKWANIKHRKGTVDARRSKLFTKLVKEIMVAAKVGGPVVESNPRLKMAIQNARGASVPKDNIERAISKASAQDGADFLDVHYEGYGPHGVAILVECTTDNLNRTIQNVKSYFNKAGGSLSTNGSLDFIFSQKGVFRIPQPDGDMDVWILRWIDSGAQEVEIEDGKVTLQCEREDFGRLQKALHDEEIEAESSGLERIPLITKELNREQAEELGKLLQNLENDDDVKAVYHNIAFAEEIADIIEA
ncbi:MAG: YebC/PmpR family DNA-binding transcriptional regulator [Bacteroidetes bacterium]|nr:YebC/PmpR family DNA-binding transcriptional regulator [Bacteroidota bacterium]